LSPYLLHLLVHRYFDLCPRRFGVLFPPLGHPQQVSQSCADLLYLLTALPFILLGFHALVPLRFFLSFTTFRLSAKK